MLKHIIRATVLVSFSLPLQLLAAPVSEKLPVIPKWTRFEQPFRSGADYTNPVQQVKLEVVFTSPLGQMTRVEGFWDGGKVWRVRFTPNLAGRWTFKTDCSDNSNSGLHNQTGAFLCTSTLGTNRFHQHGPIQLAADRLHFSHEDGTPFFWLADTVWNGARIADAQDWDLYARVRAAQGFTVAQWSVQPGGDHKNQSALSGFRENIGINPDFFQRLDAKLDRLRQGGILSAIAPLLELESETEALQLPEDQAVILLRYSVARWGADPVVWLLAFDTDSKGETANRWRKIGQSVFGESQHAPVLVYAGRNDSFLRKFDDQPWADAFGMQSEDGLISRQGANPTGRLLIPFLPYENGVSGQSGKRFSSDDVRHSAYWSLLATVPAGISYGGQGVLNWDQSVQTQPGKAPGSKLPLWEKCLFMPAAKQMGVLVNFMNDMDYWRLHPEPEILASRSSDQIVAAATAKRDIGLVYVLGKPTLDLVVDRLPPSPRITWFSPRTGETRSAVAVVVGQTCQFPVPEAGDWVLLIKTGK